MGSINRKVKELPNICQWAYYNLVPFKNRYGEEYKKTLDESLTPIGLLGPGAGLGDPTGEGGIIQKLGEFLGLTDPIDPENEGLPMDEFQGELPPGSMTETLEASADTYTLPNLLQMLQDARDAGNEDEIELLTNDLEMLFPGSTMTI